MTTDESVPKIPNLKLAQLKFRLSQKQGTPEATTLVAELVTGIQADQMGPFYEQVVNELKLKKDEALLKNLVNANELELKKLEEKLTDAEQNLGETDISDALIAKAQYLARIGDKERALTAYRVAFEKTGPLGHRIDIIFAILRIGFFFSDDDLISRNIEKAKSLIEEGGDWDRRNRLKVYEGVYLLSIRNFTTAAQLFLDTLATFTSTELIDYKTFILYACLSSAITLNRPDFKSKLVNAPEVLEVIHEIPSLSDYVNSYYNCNYAQFFTSLAAIEQTLKDDRLLNPHYKYYVREMRIAVYNQLLQSYRSLTIESMAKSFGVSEDWIDNDLSTFISSGRINAVIDKVGGVIETNRPDVKNAQYQSVIKQGDLLLTRIQKLSRVINV